MALAETTVESRSVCQLYNSGVKIKGVIFLFKNENIFSSKVESSGWPDGVSTAEQKQAYIREYRELEGVELEESNIKTNKGFRHLA